MVLSAEHKDKPLAFLFSLARSPHLAPATCFPAPTTLVTCFPALGTGCMCSRPCHAGYMFSCAWHGLYVFSPCVMISRSLYGLHVFPRLALVTCFPALTTGFTFSSAYRWLHIFALSSDWSIPLFLFVAIGQLQWLRFGFTIVITKPLHVWRQIVKIACKVYLQMLLSSDATTNKSRFSTKMDLNRAMLLVCSDADDIWKTETKTEQPLVKVNSVFWHILIKYFTHRLLF